MALTTSVFAQRGCCLRGGDLARHSSGSGSSSIFNRVAVLPPQRRRRACLLPVCQSKATAPEAERHYEGLNGGSFNGHSAVNGHGTVNGHSEAEAEALRERFAHKQERRRNRWRTELNGRGANGHNHHHNGEALELSNGSTQLALNGSGSSVLGDVNGHDDVGTLLDGQLNGGGVGFFVSAEQEKEWHFLVGELVGSVRAAENTDEARTHALLQVRAHTEQIPWAQTRTLQARVDGH